MASALGYWPEAQPSARPAVTLTLFPTTAGPAHSAAAGVGPLSPSQSPRRYRTTSALSRTCSHPPSTRQRGECWGPLPARLVCGRNPTWVVQGHLSSAVVQAAHCVTISATTCFVDILAL